MMRKTLLTFITAAWIAIAAAAWAGGPGGAVSSLTASTIAAALGYMPVAPGKTIVPNCSNTSIPSGNGVASDGGQGAGNEVLFATSCTLPAMSTVGAATSCKAYGILSVSGSIPSLRGRVFINGVPVLDTTPIISLVSGGGFQWRANFDFLTLAAGTSGSVDAQGNLVAQIGTTSELPIPVRNATPYTVNTNSMVLTLGATWGNAVPGSLITLRQLVCK